MHREPQALPRLAEAGGLQRASVAAGAVLACLAAVLALYLHTTQSLYGIWLRSETFAHGLIVFPVFAWMVWNERWQLARVPLSPCLPALALVALAGFVWLLGRLSASAVVEQFSMIALVPAATWAVLGGAAMRVLAFPFAFLFLAVPFGDFLVPVLIDRTADFTVEAVRLSGVPIYRRGNTFEIPTGSWSVVEACSGVRYLMASVLGGMLFSYFFFRSWKRRVGMVLLAVLVAVLGNWLRAYLIVMLGHLSDNELAAGVDHLVYGWLFFGVVIAVLFAIGLRWARAERDTRARSGAPPEPQAPVHLPGGPALRRLLPASAAAVVMLLAWPAAHALYRPLEGRVPAIPRIPETAGWRDAAAGPDWQPNYRPHALLQQDFVRGDGQVGVYVAYYRNQHEQDELIRSRTTVIGPDNREWAVQRPKPVQVDGTPELTANAASVRSPSGEWEVWQWYWIGGQVTSDGYRAKAYLALHRLLGSGDDAAAVMLYTRATDGAHERLQQFARDLRPAIDAALARTQAGAAREP
jgi:exosortase A